MNSRAYFFGSRIAYEMRLDSQRSNVFVMSALMTLTEIYQR